MLFRSRVLHWKKRGPPCAPLLPPPGWPKPSCPPILAGGQIAAILLFRCLYHLLCHRSHLPPVTGAGSPHCWPKIILLKSRPYLLMCDKEAIEVQKILPFLSDTWPLCRIGRAVIRASQSCRQSCNKSQCPACGCRSHHSCTHAPQFSRSFPAREWGSVLQRQGACGQCP